MVSEEILSPKQLHDKKHKVAVDLVVISGASVLIFFGYGMKIEFYGRFQGMEHPDFQGSFHHLDKVLFLVVGKDFKIKIKKFRKPVVIHTGSAVDSIGGSVQHIPLF